MDSGFKTRISFFSAGFIFDSTKKILKSLVNPIRDILFNLRMHIGILTCKMSVVVEFPECFSFKVIISYRKLKKMIIDFLAGFKCVKKTFPLLTGRIQPVFIHSEFHSYYKLYIYGGI